MNRHAGVPVVEELDIFTCASHVEIVLLFIIKSYTEYKYDINHKNITHQEVQMRVQATTNRRRRDVQLSVRHGCVRCMINNAADVMSLTSLSDHDVRTVSDRHIVRLTSGQ